MPESAGDEVNQFSFVSFSFGRNAVAAVTPGGFSSPSSQAGFKKLYAHCVPVGTSHGRAGWITASGEVVSSALPFLTVLWRSVAPSPPCSRSFSLQKRRLTSGPFPRLLRCSRRPSPSFSISTAPSKCGNTCESQCPDSRAVRERLRGVFPSRPLSALQLGLPSAPQPRRALRSLRDAARTGSHLRGVPAARCRRGPAQARPSPRRPPLGACAELR